jgi:hypothetical protein
LIISIEESTWSLRSRAIWINKGDKNTKFFHKFATQRRSQNTIWDIVDDVGVRQSVDYEIKKITLKHFKHQCIEIVAEDTYSQIKVLEHMPKFFNETKSDEIGKGVMLEEVI